MQIAFYRYSLLNRGGDRMVIEYANHLAESGHSVTLFFRVNTTVFKLSPRLDLRRIPWPGPLGFLAYTLLHKLFFQVVIADIIHLSPFLRCAGTLVYFAQADDVEYYGHSLPRWCVDQLYRRYFAKGGLCIAVSEHLVEMFQKRYAAQHCRTVVNGIDLKTFYPQPDEELLVSKGDRRAVFFMARGDRYRKGYDLALDLFARFPSAVASRMELWVCGDRLEGDYAFPIRNFGVVDDDRLRQILSSADIFFYPSRHEGFGLFPLEAMACGCVVVTTEAVPYARRYPCIHTAIVGGTEQLLSIMEQLLLRPEQIELDRNRGFDVAASFDLQRSKEAFVQALAVLAGDRACA